MTTTRKNSIRNRREKSETQKMIERRQEERKYELEQSKKKTEAFKKRIKELAGQ
ncbi:hypothetical protein [Salicibibacter kimchii]|uniref:hypothetical protein n=1 Tax=Salicibibacter kimchii TaxID=2099786 RepID=UPI00135B2AA6|nr:hypothetical protein [Salicibibacter kimchii]